MSDDDGRVVRVVEAGTDKASSLAHFARDLDLPSWFGHNLDALADVLRDLTDERGRPILLVWQGTERLRRRDPAAYRSIAAVLRDVAAERDDLDVRLA